MYFYDGMLMIVDVVYKSFLVVFGKLMLFLKDMIVNMEVVLEYFIKFILN